MGHLGTVLSVKMIWGFRTFEALGTRNFARYTAHIQYLIRNFQMTHVSFEPTQAAYQVKRQMLNSFQDLVNSVIQLKSYFISCNLYLFAIIACINSCYYLCSNLLFLDLTYDSRYQKVVPIHNTQTHPYP